MLRMIAGLETISYGELKIDGKLVNDLPSRDRGIAMVFQNYALYPHMNVRDNLGFGLKIRKFAPEEIDARVQEAADILGIHDLLDRKPRELSGGQRQRVAIGRAIVRQPAVFLFDEPLSNLDAQLRNEMRTEIKRLHQRLGATIIYVTHDQTEAMTLADRICVLQAGHKMQYDTPDAIYNRPAALFVAGFTGAPPMNLSACTLGAGRADLGGASIALPPALARAAVADCQLGIRPENIGLAPAGADDIRIPAEVMLLEPLGSETLVTLKVGRAEWIARCPASFKQAPGHRLDVFVPPEALRLFDNANGRAVLH
jgi:multiple sugar transport system ATP-binding protein